MGRPFATEVASLAENISFGLEHSVRDLREGIERAQEGRILACGAGGSYSAAAFAELLFEEVKADAPAITPLKFLQSKRPRVPTTLLLFTAGGRNKDVLRVIEHARYCGVTVLLVCATKNSPAAILAQTVSTNVVFEFSYPP